MKRLFLSLLISVCTLCVAQNNHMKFKGIPMEGPVESFVKKLEAKGYTYLGQQDALFILQGEFAAEKDCVIGVTTENNEVKSVTVFFHEKETWGELSREYYMFKSLLTEKYGKPECIEGFKDEE